MVGGVVLLSGVIRGLGHEVVCGVLAWKAGAAAAFPMFSQFKVVEAPRHLPDGSYTVSFGGCDFSTKKQSGWWTLESVL